MATLMSILVIIGFILLISVIIGLILLFKDDIDNFFHPDKYFYQIILSIDRTITIKRLNKNIVEKNSIKHKDDVYLLGKSFQYGKNKAYLWKEGTAFSLDPFIESQDYDSKILRTYEGVSINEWFKEPVGQLEDLLKKYWWILAIGAVVIAIIALGGKK